MQDRRYLKTTYETGSQNIMRRVKSVIYDSYLESHLPV
uniref:Uncharacterized protein n=1 Tax=Rhizophora mucronata TaxID=61149 RepID=A0A2P2JAQ1_RHIMU